MESELFGHERGAFTGAQTQHKGYAERARDGVLFLDEVGDLSPSMQAKLLRLLQERSFFRLGGDQPIRCTARIICATNRDLDALVGDGRFREDLFYRINVIPVTIPALRDRSDDILSLASTFIRHFNRDFGRSIRGLSGPGKAALLNHAWPGNVRELRNRLERAVALSDEPWIGPSQLFPDLSDRQDEDGAAPPLGTLAQARAEAERQQIERALERTDGQLAKAAEILGVSRTTLWEKMRKLGCPPRS